MFGRPFPTYGVRERDSVLRTPLCRRRRHLVSPASQNIYTCPSSDKISSDIDSVWYCNETARMATAEASTHELTTFTRADLQDDNTQQEQQQDFQSLPPADSGKDAYLFLAACVGLEALVWGFPFAVSQPSIERKETTLITITVRCLRSLLRPS